MSAEAAVCRICSTPNYTINFGVDACRACSAFFKRVVLSGRQYSCRTGQRQCDLNRDAKFNCRRCRYDKCVAVGMRHDKVIGVDKKSNEEGKEISLPTDISPIHNESMLYRIGREYEKNVINRQREELAMLRECSSAKRVPHAPQELYSSLPNILRQTMQFTVQESWTFFHIAFPSLKHLSFQEQMDLYRFYILKFIMTDSFSRTWKIWESFDKYYMCSVSTCIDLKSPNSWLNENDTTWNREAHLNSSTRYVRNQMAIMVPSLVKARITDREVYALFALALCDTDIKINASECLLSVLDDIRKEVLQDLKIYYREEMGLVNYSTRLGNLMNVCHAIRECSHHFSVFVRTQITLFDSWSTATQLKELFL
ncbi:hypothetical protein PENTCL1PPCAC_15755 [Pristionchus entomophagus]|uniref:Nuclear receptor domain-containing protein n=1 Tax=Pristionchus entomophagus TaxID=358040 RepID=A0AAV5TGM2_9BILA|nr:hypothetical protein PENTCL1PPCAC_15755 [Pristionchus entomophagus]